MVALTVGTSPPAPQGPNDLTFRAFATDALSRAMMKHSDTELGR
jgi:hypothetical protein